MRFSIFTSLLVILAFAPFTALAQDEVPEKDAFITVLNPVDATLGSSPRLGSKYVLSKKGDTNGDGVIDSTDIAYIIDDMLGIEHSNYIKANADLDGNGDVNATDISLLIQKLLGLSSSGENMTFTANGVSFNMVYVEGGTFQMGATAEQSNGYTPDSDETPVHTVTLSDYHIGETEVTQELWKAVMGASPSSSYSWSSSKGLGDKYPAYYISYTECQEFITKLNALTGQTFRMPTEAEWEYAARGGNQSKGYIFSGSDTIGNVAWYDDNSGSKTHEVATKAPNELGIYDMSGNVYEWCSDWYGSYSSSSQTNPTGPTSGSERVYRGGGWSTYAPYCRVAYRYYYSPGYRDNNLGLRLVL